MVMLWNQILSVVKRHNFVISYIFSYSDVYVSTIQTNNLSDNILLFFSVRIFSMAQQLTTVSPTMFDSINGSSLFTSNTPIYKDIGFIFTVGDVVDISTIPSMYRLVFNFWVIMIDLYDFYNMIFSMQLSVWNKKRELFLFVSSTK